MILKCNLQKLNSSINDDKIKELWHLHSSKAILKMLNLTGSTDDLEYYAKYRLNLGYEIPNMRTVSEPSKED